MMPADRLIRCNIPRGLMVLLVLLCGFSTVPAVANTEPAPVKVLSLDVAKHNVTINNMLPERFDTQRQEQMARAWMKREDITYEQARALQVKAIAANRLGRPEEFGAAFAFLCSAHAGYISGQNLHLDGGSYPALL